MRPLWQRILRQLFKIHVINIMGLLSEIFFPSLKSNCFINEVAIKVKPLTTPAQHSMGFMFQEEPMDNEGLLFVYPASSTNGFWMKNVDFDLDLVLFDKNKKIIEIIELLANDETIKEPSCGNYYYALEVKKGFCQKHNLSVGDKMTIRL